jgi:YHS domain-containing protein
MDAGSILDPVCGRVVDPLRARAVGIFGGTTYYFCSADCKSRYADPRAPRDPNAPPRVAERKPAPPAKPAPTPKMELPRAVIAAPPPASEPPPAEIEPPPEARSRSLLGIGLGIAVGTIAAWFVYSRIPGPPPPAPVVAAAPLKPAPLPVAPAPSTPAPSTPAPADRELTALAAPIKLGLRRFVARADEDATLSWQLLVIDASGRAAPVVVADVKSSTDDAKDVTEEAVAPEADFVAARREPGTVFQDTLHAKGQRFDVRVVRLADLLVAETRESADGADAEAAKWQRRLHMSLAENDLVRGAPFARKRYTDPGEAPTPK